MAHSVITLYHDRTTTVTSEFLLLRGVSKILGRRERFALDAIVAFRLREAAEYPYGRVPEWGISDENVWFVKDPQRWRRRSAIELVLQDGRAIGFTPAHAARVAAILETRGVKRSS